MSQLDNAEEIEVELTLTENMQKQFADVLEMEIDLLKGKVQTFDNGASLFKMKLSGVKKAMMIDFFRMTVSLPTNQVQVKINGLPINNN